MPITTLTKVVKPVMGDNRISMVAFMGIYLIVLLLLTGSILAIAELVGAVRLLLAVCVDKRRKVLDWPAARLLP